jgi:PAS domain S-box-containing protein
MSMEGVLIVDDELLTRKISSDILAAEGYRVLTAPNADAGIRVAAAEAVAAVVLDLMMPGMDGIAAIRELARVAPDAPVIICTAFSSRQHILDALKSGAYDFLSKPFQPQDLVSAVNRAFDRHRLLAENRSLLAELKAKVEELSHLNAAAADFARTLEAEVERKTRDLQKSTQLTENIVANMGSGLMVTDLEGRITRLNPTGEETFRLPRGAAEGRLLLDLFPGAGDLLRVQPGAREITLRRADGSRIPLGFNTSHLSDPEGRREGIIIVFRDLSEIKTLQGQIRQKDRLATIGEVAAKMAHEIRNPLAGISYVAQILKREVRFEPSHQELVQAMFSEIKRLNGIIDDLLLYGRPAALILAPQDLHAIWEEIISLSKAQLDVLELTLVRDFDPALPSVAVDGNRMRQVFLNLLKNAMEATGPGGLITVRTRLVAGPGAGGGADGWAEVSVEDTGGGIPAEEQERVFELFFTTKPSGSGLGLPICRRIVAEHGGSIHAASRPGAGSAFTIRLPRANIGAGV